MPALLYPAASVLDFDHCVEQGFDGIDRLRVVFGRKVVVSHAVESFDGLGHAEQEPAYVPVVVVGDYRRNRLEAEPKLCGRETPDARTELFDGLLDARPEVPESVAIDRHGPERRTRRIADARPVLPGTARTVGRRLAADAGRTPAPNVGLPVHDCGLVAVRSRLGGRELRVCYRRCRVRRHEQPVPRACARLPQKPLAGRVQGVGTDE